MLRFYFKRMVKKYAEVQLSKNLRLVAKTHFVSVTKQTCFHEWRRVIKERKRRHLGMVGKLKKNPRSLLLLMAFVGFRVMPKEQQKSFDVLDLYSYVTLKKKFKIN